MGMFEQSLLLDHAAGKKTGALAASLTVQTLAVGVMIAIPLLYSDRLPAVPRFISLSFPAPPPPLPPPVEPTVTTRSSRPSTSRAPVYRAPTRIIPLSEMPTISTDEAPAAFSNASSEGVPGGTGPATALMEQIFKPIPPASPKPKAEATPAPAKPITVSQGVQEAKILKRVMPVYPPLARQARVSGTVRLIGVIARDGTMQQLQLVSGHPLLVDAALSAVRQWIYRPTLLNGQAVEVIAPIDVIFSLSQ
jgi:protein TonB